MVNYIINWICQFPQSWLVGNSAKNVAKYFSNLQKNLQNKYHWITFKLKKDWLGKTLSSRGKWAKTLSKGIFFGQTMFFSSNFFLLKGIFLVKLCFFSKTFFERNLFGQTMFFSKTFLKGIFLVKLCWAFGRLVSTRLLTKLSEEIWQKQHIKDPWKMSAKGDFKIKIEITNQYIFGQKSNGPNCW